MNGAPSYVYIYTGAPSILASGAYYTKPYIFNWLKVEVRFVNLGGDVEKEVLSQLLVSSGKKLIEDVEASFSIRSRSNSKLLEKKRLKWNVDRGRRGRGRMRERREGRERQMWERRGKEEREREREREVRKRGRGEERKRERETGAGEGYEGERK